MNCFLLIYHLHSAYILNKDVLLGERKDDMIAKWEEKSREFIENFLLLFGRERLSNIWNESKGKILSALSPPGSPQRPGSPSSSTEDLDLLSEDGMPPFKSPRFESPSPSSSSTSKNFFSVEDYSDEEDFSLPMKNGKL